MALKPVEAGVCLEFREKWQNGVYFRSKGGNYVFEFIPYNSFFHAEKDSEATQVIFDANGRLVRSLVDGHFPAGEHSATWRRKLVC